MTWLCEWLKKLACKTAQNRATMSRPIRFISNQFASNCVQNQAFWRPISGREASKANCVNRTYGAGDGNRTHVRTWGYWYSMAVDFTNSDVLPFPLWLKDDQKVRADSSSVLWQSFRYSQARRS